jgi:hypothetical protein
MLARLSFALAAFSVVATLSSQAFAQNSGIKDFRVHQLYQSPRALGMGNTVTAIADDYSTLFYNPAGLARLEEGQLNMSLGGYVDRKIPDFYKDIQDASKQTNSGDEYQAYVDLLEKNFGQTYTARLSLLQAVWVRPKWGIALLPIDLNMDLSIRRLAVATLNVVATQDTTFAYGRGWDVKWFGPKHRLSMGVTGKALYRGYYNQALFASDLAADEDILRSEDAAEGFTVDADWGMLWTPLIPSNSRWRFAKPTVGLVVRNVADYGFKTNFHLVNKDSGAPPKLGRRVDLGVKFDLPDWWVWRTRLASDLRDVGDDNFTLKKGSHLGAEFLWKIRSWWQGGWRIGLNQGYFTAGFTGTAGVFTLDLVTYGDDVGPSNQPKQVRAYGARASLDF